MRRDMHKVLVNKPGHKHTPRTRAKRRRYARDQVLAQGLERQAHRETWGDSFHWTRTNSAPLKRFLHKQVGRPWSKVWAEICEHANIRAFVQSQLRNLVFEFVHTVTRVEGKTVFGYAESHTHRVCELSKGRLYICPKTGLLREVGKTTHRASKLTRKASRARRKRKRANQRS